jgi:hypothetical protein
LRAVRAAADFALPYEPRTTGHRELRTELRERLRRLTCRDDEVLHASFFGPKPANADVENLLLYNVDDSGRAFTGAVRGVRFELSPRPMPNATREFTYLYRPVPRSGAFALWTEIETVAAWPSVTLDRPDERAAVWLAFRSHLHDLGVRCDGAFGVRVRLRPGVSGQVASVRLVKPLLDGVVAALQAHGDHTTIGAVSDRLAVATGRSADTIEDLLGDSSAAALGIVERLVHLRSDGFQLCPEDERCVAGEVLVEPGSADAPFEARCEVVALSARASETGAARAGR